MADWPIERVVCRDGVANEMECVLQEGILYASDKKRGGNNAFLAVSKTSFQVWDRHPPEENICMALLMLEKRICHAITSVSIDEVRSSFGTAESGTSTAVMTELSVGQPGVEPVETCASKE